MAIQLYRLQALTSTRKRRGRYPVSPATWLRWEKNGTAPQGFWLGPNVKVWDAETLDAWDIAKMGGQ